MARPTLATQVNDYLNSLNLCPNFSQIEKGTLRKVFRRITGKVLQSNLTVNSNTLADVPGITFNVKKGVKYRLEGTMLNLADATSGIKYALTVSNQTSPTVVLTGTSRLAAATATQRALSGGTIFTAAGISLQVDINGYYIPDANGVAQLQASTFTGTTAATVYAGSHLKLIRVG